MSSLSQNRQGTFGPAVDRLLAPARDEAGFRRLVVRLAVLAFGLRVLAVFVVNDWHAPEDWEYGTIARNLIAGHGFSGSAWFVPEGPTAFMAPAYVFFLAAGYALLGEAAYLPLQLVQAAAGALAVALIAAIGRRIFGPVAGLCAGAVLAFNPTHAYLASQVHPLVFLSLVTLVVIGCALRLGDQPRPGRAVALGAAIGAAMLTDPAIAIAAPVLGLYPVVKHWPQWRRGVALGAITTAAACAVVAPWTIRNYLVFERFILVKSPAGLALWIGNHPGATGTQFALDDTGTFEHAVERMDPALRARLEGLGEPAAYHELGRMARAHMWAHPHDAALGAIRKAAYFWWYPTWLTDPFDAQQPIRGQFRHPYKYVWAAVLLLAMVGLVHRRRDWRRWGLLAVVLVCYTGLYAATNVGSNPRYRIPVEPLVMVFSGAGLARLAGYPRVTNAPSASSIPRNQAGDTS